MTDLTDAQIKHMVDRFLCWRLPENFNPDGGISFKATFNEHSPWGPSKSEPSGTNLFDAEQATAMVRHMIEGLPSADALSAPQAAGEDWVLVPRVPTTTMLAEMGCYRTGEYGDGFEFYTAMLAAAPKPPTAPIPMVLHCPYCHAQHTDKPEPEKGWDNPSHASHLCHNCGAIWRPASVDTVGVESVPAGKHDKPPARAEAEVRKLRSDLETATAQWRGEVFQNLFVRAYCMLDELSLTARGPVVPENIREACREFLATCESEGIDPEMNYHEAFITVAAWVVSLEEKK